MTRLQKIMAALEDSRPTCSYCAEHTQSRATVTIDGIDYPVCSYAYPVECGKALEAVWSEKPIVKTTLVSKKESRIGQIGKVFSGLMQTIGHTLKSIFEVSSTEKAETLEDWTIRTLESSESSADVTADYPTPVPCLVSYPCRDCGEFFHFDFYLDEGNRRCSVCFDKFIQAELEKRVYTCSVCSHDFWAKESPTDSSTCPDCIPGLFFSFYEDSGSLPAQQYTCSVCSQDFLAVEPNNISYITSSPLCDDCERNS